MHEITTRLISATAVAAVLALGSGCATPSYRVHVDAVRHEPFAGEERLSYRLVSANPERADDDLRVKQAAAHVKTALSSKGLYEAPPNVAPDLVIEVDFDIEAPRQVLEQRTVPVRSNRDDPLSAPLVEDGQRTITVLVTVYDKFVRITAREDPGQCGDHAPRELWSVIATNTDESDDLDRYVPLLVAAAMDEITRDSGKPQETRIAGDDDRVVFIERGL